MIMNHNYEFRFGASMTHSVRYCLWGFSLSDFESFCGLKIHRFSLLKCRCPADGSCFFLSDSACVSGVVLLHFIVMTWS